MRRERGCGEEGEGPVRRKRGEEGDGEVDIEVEVSFTPAEFLETSGMWCVGEVVRG